MAFLNFSSLNVLQGATKVTHTLTYCSNRRHYLELFYIQIMWSDHGTNELIAIIDCYPNIDVNNNSNFAVTHRENLEKRSSPMRDPDVP